MRILLLLLVMALSGCFGEEVEEPDIFGACPQWIAGPDVVTAAGNETIMLAPALEFQGRPLDLLVLTVEGTAEVRAYSDSGTRLLLRQGKDALPVVAVDGSSELRVFLTAVTHGTQPAPGPVRLDVTGPVAVSAEPFYRVCGVPNDTSST